MYEHSWKKAIELAVLTLCKLALVALALFCLYCTPLLRNFLLFSLIAILVTASIIKLFWWLSNKINKYKNLKASNKCKENE